jgi:predicted Zn-dependent protease
MSLLRLARCASYAFLSACTVAPTMSLPATVEISDELSAEDVESTLQAVDAWNQEVPGIIVATKMRNSPSKKERTIFVKRGKGLTEHSDAYSKTSFCRSTAIIADNAKDIFVVVAHEFGHAFGLDDTSDAVSIMGRGKTITSEDAADARHALRTRREQHKECRNKEWLRLN